MNTNPPTDGSAPPGAAPTGEGAPSSPADGPTAGETEAVSVSAGARRPRPRPGSTAVVACSAGSALAAGCGRELGARAGSTGEGSGASDATGAGEASSSGTASSCTGAACAPGGAASTSIGSQRTLTVSPARLARSLVTYGTHSSAW